MEKGSHGEVSSSCQGHTEGSSPETLEMHLNFFISNSRKSRIGKWPFWSFQNCENILMIVLKRRPPKHKTGWSECSTVCKMHSHAGLHFIFRITPSLFRYGNGNRGEKGHPAYQEALRLGNLSLPVPASFLPHRALPFWCQSILRQPS